MANKYLHPNNRTVVVLAPMAQKLAEEGREAKEKKEEVIYE